MSITDILLIILLLISLYTDMVERKIYNKVTLTAALAGIAVNTFYSGAAGFQMSLLGMLVGTAALFLPFVMGGIGAGDVKLLGAVGAVKGSAFVLYAAVASALVGGIIALVILLHNKRLLAVVKNTLSKVAVITLGRSIRHIESETLSVSFPYGAAIFIGTVLTLVTRWNLWLL